MADIPDWQNLLNYTVEQRNSTTGHEVPQPNTTQENMCDELERAIQMNHDATIGGWPTTTMNLLIDYCPLEIKPTISELRIASRDVMGFRSWREASDWVAKDLCTDGFGYVMRYLLKKGYDRIENRGFLAGDCLGYMNDFVQFLEPISQKTFDAKWFYRVSRPVHWAWENRNMDLRTVARNLNPSHYSYPAQHGTVAYANLVMANRIFSLPNEEYRKLFLAMYVVAMARSGNLIHYPMDNLASIPLFGNELLDKIQIEFSIVNL